MSECRDWLLRYKQIMKEGLKTKKLRIEIVKPASLDRNWARYKIKEKP